MEKKNYKSPTVEQVRVEAEMPVICASGPEPKMGGTLQNISGWNQ